MPHRTGLTINIEATIKAANDEQERFFSTSQSLSNFIGVANSHAQQQLHQSGGGGGGSISGMVAHTKSRTSNTNNPNNRSNPLLLLSTSIASTSSPVAQTLHHRNSSLGGGASTSCAIGGGMGNVVGVSSLGGCAPSSPLSVGMMSAAPVIACHGNNNNTINSSSLGAAMIGAVEGSGGPQQRLPFYQPQPQQQGVHNNSIGGSNTSPYQRISQSPPTTCCSCNCGVGGSGGGALVSLPNYFPSSTNPLSSPSFGAALNSSSVNSNLLCTNMGNSGNNAPSNNTTIAIASLGNHRQNSNTASNANSRVLLSPSQCPQCHHHHHHPQHYPQHQQHRPLNSSGTRGSLLPHIPNSNEGRGGVGGGDEPIGPLFMPLAQHQALLQQQQQLHSGSSNWGLLTNPYVPLPAITSPTNAAGVGGGGVRGNNHGPSAAAVADKHNSPSHLHSAGPPSIASLNPPGSNPRLYPHPLPMPFPPPQRNGSGNRLNNNDTTTGNNNIQSPHAVPPNNIAALASSSSNANNKAASGIGNCNNYTFTRTSSSNNTTISGHATDNNLVLQRTFSASTSTNAAAGAGGASPASRMVVPQRLAVMASPPTHHSAAATCDLQANSTSSTGSLALAPPLSVPAAASHSLLGGNSHRHCASAAIAEQQHQLVAICSPAIVRRQQQHQPQQAMNGGGLPLGGTAALNGSESASLSGPSSHHNSSLPRHPSGLHQQANQKKAQSGSNEENGGGAGVCRGGSSESNGATTACGTSSEPHTAASVGPRGDISGSSSQRMAIGGGGWSATLEAHQHHHHHHHHCNPWRAAGVGSSSQNNPLGIGEGSSSAHSEALADGGPIAAHFYQHQQHGGAVGTDSVGRRSSTCSQHMSLHSNYRHNSGALLGSAHDLTRIHSQLQLLRAPNHTDPTATPSDPRSSSDATTSKQHDSNGGRIPPSLRPSSDSGPTDFAAAAQHHHHGGLSSPEGHTTQQFLHSPKVVLGRTIGSEGCGTHPEGEGSGGMVIFAEKAVAEGSSAYYDPLRRPSVRGIGGETPTAYDLQHQPEYSHADCCAPLEPVDHSLLIHHQRHHQQQQQHQDYHRTDSNTAVQHSDHNSTMHRGGGIGVVDDAAAISFDELQQKLQQGGGSSGVESVQGQRNYYYPAHLQQAEQWSHGQQQHLHQFHHAHPYQHHYSCDNRDHSAAPHRQATDAFEPLRSSYVVGGAYVFRSPADTSISLGAAGGGAPHTIMQVYPPIVLDDCRRAAHHDAVLSPRAASDNVACQYNHHHHCCCNHPSSQHMAAENDDFHVDETTGGGRDANRYFDRFFYLGNGEPAFVELAVIGKGAGGSVRKAQHRVTGDLFAVKEIRCINISQLEQTKREIQSLFGVEKEQQQQEALQHGGDRRRSKTKKNKKKGQHATARNLDDDDDALNNDDADRQPLSGGGGGGGNTRDLQSKFVFVSEGTIDEAAGAACPISSGSQDGNMMSGAGRACRQRVAATSATSSSAAASAGHQPAPLLPSDCFGEGTRGCDDAAPESRCETAVHSSLTTLAGGSPIHTETDMYDDGQQSKQQASAVAAIPNVTMVPTFDCAHHQPLESEELTPANFKFGRFEVRPRCNSSVTTTATGTNTTADPSVLSSITLDPRVVSSSNSQDHPKSAATATSMRTSGGSDGGAHGGGGVYGGVVAVRALADDNDHNARHSSTAMMMMMSTTATAASNNNNSSHHNHHNSSLPFTAPSCTTLTNGLLSSMTTLDDTSELNSHHPHHYPHAAMASYNGTRVPSSHQPIRSIHGTGGAEMVGGGGGGGEADMAVDGCRAATAFPPFHGVGRGGGADEKLAPPLSPTDLLEAARFSVDAFSMACTDYSVPATTPSTAALQMTSGSATTLVGGLAAADRNLGAVNGGVTNTTATTTTKVSSNSSALTNIGDAARPPSSVQHAPSSTGLYPLPTTPHHHHTDIALSAMTSEQSHQYLAFAATDSLVAVTLNHTTGSGEGFVPLPPTAGEAAAVELTTVDDAQYAGIGHASSNKHSPPPQQQPQQQQQNGNSNADIARDRRYQQFVALQQQPIASMVSISVLSAPSESVSAPRSHQQSPAAVVAGDAAALEEKAVGAKKGSKTLAERFLPQPHHHHSAENDEACTISNALTNHRAPTSKFNHPQEENQNAKVNATPLSTSEEGLHHAAALPPCGQYTRLSTGALERHLAQQNHTSHAVAATDDGISIDRRGADEGGVLSAQHTIDDGGEGRVGDDAAILSGLVRPQIHTHSGVRRVSSTPLHHVSTPHTTLTNATNTTLSTHGCTSAQSLADTSIANNIAAESNTEQSQKSMSSALRPRALLVAAAAATDDEEGDNWHDDSQRHPASATAAPTAAHVLRQGSEETDGTRRQTPNMQRPPLSPSFASTQHRRSQQRFCSSYNNTNTGSSSNSAALDDRLASNTENHHPERGDGDDNANDAQQHIAHNGDDLDGTNRSSPKHECGEQRGWRARRAQLRVDTCLHNDSTCIVDENADTFTPQHKKKKEVTASEGSSSDGDEDDSTSSSEETEDEEEEGENAGTPAINESTLAAAAMPSVMLNPLFATCPTIVRSYGVTVHDQSVFVAMELLDGSLDFIRRQTRGSLPEAVLASFAHDILIGLDYLHRERHIIHRDIKPPNVLFCSRTGLAKIADFGICTSINEGDAEDGKPSEQARGSAVSPSNHDRNSFVGTVSYMSPERLLGLTYGAASDVWAAGMLVLELGMGVHPFHYFFNKSRMERMQSLPKGGPHQHSSTGTSAQASNAVTPTAAAAKWVSAAAQQKAAAHQQQTTATTTPHDGQQASSAATAAHQQQPTAAAATLTDGGGMQRAVAAFPLSSMSAAGHSNTSPITTLSSVTAATAVSGGATPSMRGTMNYTSSSNDCGSGGMGGGGGSSTTATPAGTIGMGHTHANSSISMTSVLTPAVAHLMLGATSVGGVALPQPPTSVNGSDPLSSEEGPSSTERNSRGVGGVAGGSAALKRTSTPLPVHLLPQRVVHVPLSSDSSSARAAASGDKQPSPHQPAPHSDNTNEHDPLHVTKDATHNSPHHYDTHNHHHETLLDNSMSKGGESIFVSQFEPGASFVDGTIMIAAAATAAALESVSAIVMPMPHPTTVATEDSERLNNGAQTTRRCHSSEEDKQTASANHHTATDLAVAATAVQHGDKLPSPSPGAGKVSGTVSGGSGGSGSNSARGGEFVPYTALQCQGCSRSNSPLGAVHVLSSLTSPTSQSNPPELALIYEQVSPKGGQEQQHHASSLAAFGAPPPLPPSFATTAKANNHVNTTTTTGSDGHSSQVTSSTTADALPPATDSSSPPSVNRGQRSTAAGSGAASKTTSTKTATHLSVEAKFWILYGQLANPEPLNITECMLRERRERRREATTAATTMVALPPPTTTAAPTNHRASAAKSPPSVGSKRETETVDAVAAAVPQHEHHHGFSRPEAADGTAADAFPSPLKRAKNSTPARLRGTTTTETEGAEDGDDDEQTIAEAITNGEEKALEHAADDDVIHVPMLTSDAFGDEDDDDGDGDNNNDDEDHDNANVVENNTKPATETVDTPQGVASGVKGKEGEETAAGEDPPVASSQFLDFVEHCLDKNPKTRPTAHQLLQHPFIACRASHEEVAHYLQSLLLSGNAANDHTPPAEGEGH